MGKKICLIFLTFVLALSLSALAQETTGGIQGTVKDPQGAVIPGATVEVSSPALIGKKSAITDSGGFFHIFGWFFPHRATASRHLQHFRECGRVCSADAEQFGAARWRSADRQPNHAGRGNHSGGERLG